MMGRIGRGWRLAGLGWAMLRSEPRLILLPAIATVGEGVIGASYVLGVLGVNHLHASNAHLLIVLFPVYLAVTLIDTFAVAALITVIDGRMRGEDVHLRDGVRHATGLLPNLIGWSLLSATVGTLLQLAQDKLPLVGRITAGLAGVVWSIATILAIPVLALEGRGPLATVRRSGRLFRDKWGETLVADGAANLAIGLASIPLLICAGILLLIWIPLGVAALCIVIAGIVAFSSALNATVLTAAYQLAAHGQLPAGIAENDISLAFRPRKTKD